MKIVCLIDDHPTNNKLINEHGLSFYVETASHRILFDCGQTDAFIHNAKQLNIDLSAVDICVISHGHYDHGGGLNAFLNINHQATIYIQEDAFQSFYSMRENNHRAFIGLDQSLENNHRIKLIKGNYLIDKGFTLVNQIETDLWYPSGNQSLYADDSLDSFTHEQSLVIQSNTENILLAGCAHRGILNIVKSSKKIIDDHPFDLVIAGFHLKSRHQRFQMSDERIKELGIALKPYAKTYITGHCTGEKAYHLLKPVMHHQIEEFYPGWQIIFN